MLLVTEPGIAPMIMFLKGTVDSSLTLVCTTLSLTIVHYIIGEPHFNT